MSFKKFLFGGAFVLSCTTANLLAAILPGSDIGGIENVGGASPGDLVLGFRNPTSNFDIVFDIGPFTAYENVAPIAYTIGGFNPAELLSVFPDAFTTAGTQWTVFGTTGNGNGLAKPDATLWATSNSTLNRQSTGIQRSLAHSMDATLNASLTRSSFGGNSDANVVGAPKYFTNLSSYDNYRDFFPFAVESATLGSTSLNLWELTPGSGAGVLLGTLHLDSSGLTLALIPEPATSAAMLAFATLSFATIRRRRQAQLPG